MSWWVWPLLVVVAVAVLSGLVLWVQARRRTGTVIAVRRGEGPGKRGAR